MARAVVLAAAALAVTVVLVAAATLGATHTQLRRRARGRVVTDPAQAVGLVAVVLGAGLRPDGTCTRLLARRVEAAVALHRAGAIDRLLMSGADDVNGDQPRAMAAHAVAVGVPAADIDLDRTGVDTAATCRAVARLHRDVPVVLVTQAFHAPRTAYLAAKAGLDAVVLATPDAEIDPTPLARARVREVPAAVKAVLMDDPRDGTTGRRRRPGRPLSP